MHTLRHLVLTIVIGIAVVSTSPVFAAQDDIYTKLFSKVAVSGYDPVAYFRQSRPVKGSDQFTVSWKGVTWRFASDTNRKTFQADPESYAPQYGGYCAWAVSQGYTASTDPEAWHIHNGKLYLNYSKSVREQWRQDIPGNIAKADANWPSVLER